MLSILGAGKPLPLVGSSWYLCPVPSEFMSPRCLDCRAHLCVCHCQADPSILSMSIIVSIIAITVQPWLPGASPPPQVPVCSSLPSPCLHGVSAHAPALPVGLGRTAFWCLFPRWTLQVTVLKRTTVHPCLSSENKRVQWVFSHFTWSQLETPPGLPNGMVNLTISSDRQTPKQTLDNTDNLCLQRVLKFAKTPWLILSHVITKPFDNAIILKNYENWVELRI